MKFIPYIIVLIVVITLAGNIFLLIEPIYQKKYVLWINIETGIALIVILCLCIFSKKKLRKLQQKYIHKYFSKN